MARIVLIVHNVRSAHNVGALLRTSDGLGVKEVILSGYTAYPEREKDPRLPHMRTKTERAIHKTALGAEKTVKWRHVDDIVPAIKSLSKKGFMPVALEQTEKASGLHRFHTDNDIALVIGNEVEGIDKMTLEQIPTHVSIPMQGQKESLNVAVAAAIAIYALMNQPGNPRQKTTQSLK